MSSYPGGAAILKHSTRRKELLILAISQLPVDLLILDLLLPGIDGIDVLRYLTSHPRTKALPIILCTAATQSEVAKAQRIAPHVGVVEKPFKLQTLVSAITTALNSAPASS